MLCCEWTGLCEGAQGAVLITVPWRVRLQGGCFTAEPTPRVTLSRAPRLRSEGRTPWTKCWSHGTRSIRDAQERSITDWAECVAVGAALHQLVVKGRLTVFLWDVFTLNHGVDLERCLCFHYICCVFWCDHPALRLQSCERHSHEINYNI